MKFQRQVLIALLLGFLFITNVVPCGPGYLIPVFENNISPEYPYTDFAAGRLGIIKPTMHRSALFAAYRYIGGGSFNSDEQTALINIWNGTFDHIGKSDDGVDEAVKAWVKKRGDFVPKDEKTPEIYTEREYGGFDFFPNCTKNAFEVATETLASRAATYGAGPALKEWLDGQDKVFLNCSEGQRIPQPVPAGMPEWLEKDRAYQIAAAEFYSLDYKNAKIHFAAISNDNDSPWQNIAGYLVARTLIRQASLLGDNEQEKLTPLYMEAEERLQASSAGGNFSESSKKMLGLIKFRIHPEERLSELTSIINYPGDPNFYQNLVDFTWLMDKFEKEALEAEAERLKIIEQQEAPTVLNANASWNQKGNGDAYNVAANAVSAAANAAAAAANVAAAAANSAANVSYSGGESSQYGVVVGERKSDNDIELMVYNNTYDKSWKFYIEANATDEDAVAEAEKLIGSEFTEEMRERVRSYRKYAYGARFQGVDSAYPGSYYGDVKPSLAILPTFLRTQELSDWLLAYKIQGSDAYQYAVERFRSGGSDLWLMTALSKAQKSSPNLAELLDAAKRVSRRSKAYPTIAYHVARIYLDLENNTEARKTLDGVLANTDDLPISTVNQFVALRSKLADSIDDFLGFSLKKPFIFESAGTRGTIDFFITTNKKYYDAEYNKESQAEFDKNVDKEFHNAKSWESRLMFDETTTDTINKHFPLSVLFEAEKSPAMPEYMRQSLAVVIWTRAVLLKDRVAEQKATPLLLKYHPELKTPMAPYLAATTPAARSNALVYFLLKNPVLTPYVADGMPKSDNEISYYGDAGGWCAPYDMEYDETLGDSVPKKTPPRPKFMTLQQSEAGQAEYKKLTEIGDAPNYIGKLVLAWAAKSPADPKVPESLYLASQATVWSRGNCGDFSEMHEQIKTLMTIKYRTSEWTRKMLAEEQENGY